MSPTRPLTHATVLRIRPGALVKRVKEEGVVLVPAENRFLALSEVGARALELVDGTTPFGEILSSLLAEYDVSSGQLETDLLALLEKLVDARVVEIVEGVEVDEILDVP